WPCAPVLANQPAASPVCIGLILVVTKSVAGFAGSLFGHWISPTVRTLSGGTETTTFVSDQPRARSPEKISPGTGVLAGVVTTSMSTGLAPGTVAAMGSSTLWGRSAHAGSAAASALTKQRAIAKRTSIALREPVQARKG